MYPEDRVLVGVINRKRDLAHMLQDHWYRIPQGRMPRGVETDYIALYISGSAARKLGAGIHYVARVKGVELARRRDLLPNELEHPRADERYYRVSLGDIQQRATPITNPSRRPITFIYTTWDRFQAAHTISDLYSDADHFVERVYHKLSHSGATLERLWDAQRHTDDAAPGLRITYGYDVMDTSAEERRVTMRVGRDDTDDTILATILNELEQAQGPVMITIPFDI